MKHIISSTLNILLIFTALSGFSQELKKLTESELAANQKEIEAKKQEYKRSLDNSDPASAELAGQDQKANTQSILNQQMDKSKSNASAEEFGKLALERYIEEFNAKHQTKVKASASSADAGTKVKYEQPAAPSDDWLYKSEEDIRAIKERIHQQNIAEQERIIQSGLGQSQNVKMGPNTGLKKVEPKSYEPKVIADSEPYGPTREERMEELKAQYETVFGNGKPPVSKFQAERTGPQADSTASSDSLALVAIYNALGGDFWFDNTNWLTGPVTTWYGVSWNTFENTYINGQGQTIVENVNYVTNLYLGNNNLTGTLPIEIGDLDSLRTFDFYYNNITGAIPGTIGNLTQLEFLGLGGNFIDALPLEIGQLTNLTGISLWNRETDEFGNFITSGITDIPQEFWNLTNLYDFDFGGHDISALHDSISNLSNLTTIFMWGNNLSTLPEGFGSLGMLDFLEISSNALSTLPSGFSGLINLRDLYIGNNPFIEFPQSIAGLSNLRNLNASNAGFTSLPDLSGLDSLRSLTLYNNNIASDISTFFTLDSLETLDVYGNQLTGTLDGIGNMTNLRYAYLGENEITGSIPAEISALTKLETFRAEYNLLEGSLPAELLELPMILDIQLLSNNISGTFPTTTGTSSLGALYMGNNRLEGLSASIGNFPNLAGLGLDDNRLTGSIPAEIGNLANLSHLSLGNNELSGSIPAEIGGLTNLTSLYLYGNELTGTLPVELGNCTNLQTLHLGNNLLEGDIPATIGSLEFLTELIIQENQFTSLPDLSGLVSLQIVYAFSNYFEFDDLESLAGTSAYDVQLSPQYTPAPEVNIVPQGSLVTINASVGGTANHYSWYHNGFLLDAPDTSVLTIPSIDLQTAGTYWCEITNDIVTSYYGLYLESGERTYWVSEPVSEQDSLALVDIYKATRGANWYNSQNWLKAPVVMWEGVFLRDGRVYKLDLYDKNMEGGLPPSIGDLTELEWLTIWQNPGLRYIAGELYGLTKLHYIDMDVTGIREISPAIGQLTSLDTLWIGANQYEKPIPKELFDLTNLKVLEMANTGFAGSLPEEIGQLVNLEVLWLSGNSRMTGELPASMGNLTNLWYLNLSDTKFTGGLEHLAGATNLNTLFLYNSPLSYSTLPTELSALVNLESLNISGGDYSGGVPELIWGFERLKRLTLAYMNISGEVPAGLSDLDSLTYLNIGNNEFTGALPAFKVDSMRGIYVQNNNFTDISVMENSTMLTNLVAYGNKLDFEDLAPFQSFFETNETYQYDVSFMQPVAGDYNYVQLAVGDNYSLVMDILEDSLVAIDWFQNNNYLGSGDTILLESVSNPGSDGFYEANAYHSVLSNLTGLVLFSGTTDIQVVESVLEADSLALVEVYNAIDNADEALYNWMEGPVENWFGVHAYGGRVYGLDLYGLEGTVPGAALSGLTELEILSMINGGLEGNIPEEIFNLPLLSYLDLGGNRLTGTIPTAVGNAASLSYLRLSGNFLTGSIPSEIGQISTLSDLYLHSNRLSGAVPGSFNQLDFLAFRVDRNYLSELPAGLDTALQFAYEVNFEYNNFEFDDLLRASGNVVSTDVTYAPQGTAREIYFTGNPGIDSVVTLHVERQHPLDEFYWYRSDKNSQQPYFFEIGYTGTDSTFTFTIYEDFDLTEYMAVVVNPEYQNGSYPFLSYQISVDPYEKRFATSQQSTPWTDPGAVGNNPNAPLGRPDMPPLTFDGTYGRYDLEAYVYDGWWHNALQPEFDTLRMFYEEAPIPINYIRLHSPYAEMNVSTVTLHGVNGERQVLEVYREIYNSQNQLIFPKTSFAVDQVDFAVTNGSVDAIEIGDTGSDQLAPPVLSDRYTEIGENYFYLEIIYSGLGQSIVIERSTDGQNFEVIDSVYYTGWYLQIGLPQGKYYYRAKASFGTLGVESGYSEILETGNCPPTIPPDKIWAGVSIGLDDWAGYYGERDSVYIYPQNGYANFFISDLSAGWFDNFWGYFESPAELRQKCDKIGGFSYGQIGDFTAVYENDTLYVDWFDYGNGVHGNSKFYVVADAPPSETIYTQEPPIRNEAFLSSSASVDVSWEYNALSGDVQYIVQRSVGTASGFVNLDTVATTRYKDTNTLDGQRYYYRVIALDGSLISFPSNEAYLVHKASLFDPIENAVTTDITRTSYGGSWGDFDADGDDDLYVANAFELAANFLYQNNGNGTFTKVIGTVATTEIGFSRTSVWGDYDNDGFMDLYVPGSTTYGDRVYRNTGSRSFVVANQAVSDASTAFSPSEAGIWVDLNGDGWLDLVKSIGYVFMNDGAGNLSLSDTLSVDGTNLPMVSAYFWTVSNEDIDNDGDQDIYITSDFRNMLFLNDGAGNLEYTENEISNEFVGSRGYTWADFNNDGNIDLITGDVTTEALGIYANLGDGTFEFISIGEMVRNVSVDGDVTFGRGYTVADFDNDGLVDIIWTIEQRAYILFNTGGFSFNVVDVDEQAFPATNLFSHVSVADINADGAMDIFLPNQEFTGQNYLYLNNDNANNWISVRLKGIQSNKTGVGARIKVKANGTWQSQTVTTQNGISSGNSLNAEFGLGTATIADSIAVVWPSGLTTHTTNVTSNQQFLIVEIPESSGPTVNEADSTALVALYDATGGAEWTRKQGWLEGSPLGWEGTNWNDEGRLVSLILNGNNLTDTIPTEITSLTALEILDLSSNNLVGPMPSGIGNMTSLINLSLNNNQIDGTIPASVGSLANLQNLDLFNNSFFGELPATLGGLTELRQFEIQNNGFIGFVPAEIGTLSNLEILRLDNNDFEGSLPEGLGAMSSLKVLYVNNNTFTETLPEALGNLDELLELRAQNNQFSGEIPAAMAQLTGIQYVDLSNNLFAGSLAPLAGLDSIYYLNVSRNRLVDLSDLGQNSADSILARNNWLDFGDFELNNSLIEGQRLFVAPQDSLYERIDSLHEVGVAIEIFYEMGGSFNTYTWKFNGEPLVAQEGVVDIFDNLVFIASPDTPNQGEYVLEVTNENYPGVTLVTRPFNLKLSSLERDKQALLAFIAAVDKADNPFRYQPEGWSEGNELTSDWEGVTVENDRVTALVLPAVLDTDLTDGDQSRILDGNVPLSFVDLSGLVTLDLSGNFLRTFPNISNWPSIATVNISNNRLAFGSIIPNVKLGTKITYAPQRRFGVTLYDTLRAGDDIPLQFERPESGAQYQWQFGSFIPGQPFNNEVVNIEGANSRVYQIENLDYTKMGTYRVEVTHPQVPGLTISSRNKNIMASTDLFGTVFADDENTLLTDGEVIIYRKTPSGPFVAEDTTLLDEIGAYAFTDVVLGDFIVLTKPDRSIFENTIATYYEQAETYDSATTLEVRERIEGVDIEMVFYQEPIITETGADFEGLVESEFEEEGPLDEEDSRISSRRKVKRAGCSMRRFVSTGRGEQEGTYELYAYVESDDEGRFNFEGIEEGRYLLNIEYPGVPMDPESDIEFIVGGDKENQLFTLTAVITEDGILVESREVLYSMKPYIKDVKLYPNPTEDVLTADFVVYRKLNDLKMELMDVRGVKLFEQELNAAMGPQRIKLDLTNYEAGVYFMVFTDEAGTFRKQVKVGRK